jgi:hypothetical protein
MAAVILVRRKTPAYFIINYESPRGKNAAKFCGRSAAAKLLVLIKVEKLIFEAGAATRFSLSHGGSPSSPLGNGMAAQR